VPCFISARMHEKEHFFLAFAPRLLACLMADGRS